MGGAAQTGVTAMDYPNPTVVHIDVVYPSGAHGHGSGVMVGRNDVLTAGHVLYDPQEGGLAVSAHVIPFYNPAQPNARPYGEAVALQRLGEIIIDPNFPQVGVGIYPTVANNGPGYYGVEIDYGFLTLNRALGDRTSTMSLDTTFTRGVLYQSGYPHHHGDRLTQDAAYASEVTVDNLIDARSFETWTGNSGGPLWRWGGDGKAYVVGIVSTVLRPGLGVQETGRGLAAFDIDPFYASFLQLIRGNDHHIVA